MPSLLKAMRPRQWPKNGFVFAALIFDGTLENLAMRLASTTAAFILLCLMSSAVYLMNDLADIESDRQHPVKRFRPLPAGELSPMTAQIAAVIFGLGSLLLGFLLSSPFGFILLVYAVIQIAYTFSLKSIVILDVMIVAAGFVLRVGAGVVVIEIQRFSPWLYVCMGLLALFMALGKRRHELVLLGDGADNHRAILKEYTLDFIDRTITMVLTSTVVSYVMYTFLAEGLPENHAMMFTIPFVLYGVSRYLYLILVKGEGGAPEDILLRDRPFQINIFLWGMVIIFVLYVI
ncbi:MAG: decaprenyl-phosphate phosphoribosyltransferase [Ardenticatenaceae bacterium]|nr:decaprenyl-phosphate phosphoribosyltransferase [Ardenticatenaceae bacterium]